MNGRNETFTFYRGELAASRGKLLLDYDLWGLPQWRLGAMPAAPRVLDIGANVGLFSLLVQERWPGASVDAYEPHPETYKVLETNLRGRNVECHWMAITDDERMPTTFLYEGETSGECSLRLDLEDPRGRRQKERERFEVPCMYAGVLPPCDVLKVDTEGFEVPILKHYKHLAGVRVLLVEAHNVKGSVQNEITAIREIAGRGRSGAGLELLDIRGGRTRFDPCTLRMVR